MIPFLVSTKFNTLYKNKTTVYKLDLVSLPHNTAERLAPPVSHVPQLRRVQRAPGRQVQCPPVAKLAIVTG